MAVHDMPATNNEPTLSPKALTKTILEAGLAAKLTAAGLPSITIQTDSWFSMKNQKVPQIVLTNFYQETEIANMNPAATIAATTNIGYVVVHLLTPNDDQMWKLLKIIREQVLVNANNGSANPEWGGYGYKFIKISDVVNVAEPIQVNDKEAFFGKGFEGNTIGGVRTDIELTLMWDNA